MKNDQTNQAAQGTALVPTAPPPAPTALVLPTEWGMKQNYGALITSIDESTQEGRDRVMIAMMSGGENAMGWVNREFGIEDVTIHPIRFVGESGEEVQTVRVLLHLEGGEIIDFRSDGILKSLGLIYRFKGKPPYRPAHRFILERLPVGDGSRSMYSLKPVASPAKSGKAK